MHATQLFGILGNSLVGSKKYIKNQFLRDHPTCCFCGGSTPTEELDHIPSRVLFNDRQWPEGYIFPACIKCNRVSRHDEQVVAMLSRFYPDPNTQNSKSVFVERVRAVHHNYPEIIEELNSTSIRQKRNASKKYGIEPLYGSTLGDFPMLNVSGPLVNKAVINFGQKLFLALYYKHSGIILGNEGGIAIRWYTNLQIEGEEIPRELAPLVANFPVLERSRKELSDQFFYRYGHSDNNAIWVFLAFFRRTFAVLGYLNINKSKFDLAEGAEIRQPYSWLVNA